MGLIPKTPSSPESQWFMPYGVLRLPQRPSGVRKLAGGQLVDIDPQTGVAKLLRCDWIVRVPSGNPEPDFPEDLWTHLPCGGRMYAHPDFLQDPGAWVCEHGHSYAGLENEVGAYGREWENECSSRELDYWV